jgi:YgiT-type zinc finger domain-containing protein
VKYSCCHHQNLLHFILELADQKVTYSIELDGKFYIIENVPARVCIETGEKFFSPETLDHLQEIIWGQKEPIKIIETPVYAF